MSHALAAAGARQATARTVPASRGASRPPRPTLRVVRPPAVDGGRTAFVISCLLLLAAGLIGLLLINTALAQGSFRLHTLQSTSQELGDQQQQLQNDIESQAAPQRLSARAVKLGMVPSQVPAFLAPDGSIKGQVKAVAAPPRPTTSKPAEASKPAKEPKATKPAKAAKSGSTTTAAR